MGILYGTSYLDEQWVKPLGEKILVSSPIYGFDAPKTIGELTERSIRAAKLAAAIYEAAPDKGIFSVNRETDREITLLPEGSFACCELICETHYEGGNPSIAPGETKTVYLTVQNKSLDSYTLDITAQTPSGLEVMSAGGKAPFAAPETMQSSAAEKSGCHMSIAPGGQQTVDFQVRAEKDAPRRAYYSCRFLLKQEIEGNWTQMEVPFTLMTTNDWKLEADGISLGIFHGTDSAVRLKQAGLPGGKARTLTASSRLQLPEEKEVRLLVVCRKPAALLVDGRTVAESDLETPLIPAYHRAPSEKCATLRLSAGTHDVEIRLKDVEESDLFYFYVVNPANHFAAEIDCVPAADED